MDKKALTTLELKVMNILWRLKKAFVKDVLEDWPNDTKPAYNTISTTIRILEDKGFVAHEAFGRTHQYFPLINKNAYQKTFMKNVKKSLFAGSVRNMVSALLDNSKLSNEDLKDLEELINKAN